MSEQQEIAASSHHPVDDHFLPFLHALQNKVNEVLAANALYQIGPHRYSLIGHSVVTGDELYTAYLESFPTLALRQDHSCSCCKQFFRNYANLVVLAPNGTTSSLLFNDSDEIPAEYLDFVAHARALLDNTKVARVHYAASSLPTIGQLHKGTFNHFAFQLPHVLPWPNKYISSYQNSAETAEDVRLFALSLNQWSDAIVAKAKALFEHDADLSRTSWWEVLEAFTRIKAGLEEVGRDHALRHNFITAQVVLNRKGLARIAQTVLGEFLNGLSEGHSDAQVKRQFLTMVDPKDYMRPKASPTQQTVEAAEKIVAQLNLKDALRRRSLRRDELEDHVAWEKPEEAAKANDGGVFGHIKTKDQEKKAAQLPEVSGGRISMKALEEKIFDIDAEVSKVEIYLHGMPTKALGSLVTEAVAGSTPILSWDHEDHRNPVSYYTYTNPVSPSHWGLSGGWQDVVAIVDRPERWGRDEIDDVEFQPHFVLAKGYDHNNVGLPLFPQTLRNELHQVRSVIEAYARAGKLEEREQGLVVWHYNGAAEAGRGGVQIRLTTATAVVTYEVTSEK